jgi:glycosyltransferase involved in cell wall biosynthesis
MRVLHLGKYLPPHNGGIERFLAELMPAQRRAGVEAAALVHDEGAGLARCRLQSRAPVLRVPVWTTAAFTPVSPGWPGRLDRMIRRWCPDVLHLHMPNPAVFWALALPSARRLPWVVHWHADVPVDAQDRRVRALYRFYQPMENAVLRRASAVIATSTAYASSSEPLRPWRDKVRVVPLGLPDRAPALPDPSPWPPGTDFRILFVGRFSYYKGLEVLVEAMRALPRDCGLLLVGDGERRAAIEAAVRMHGLADRVRFAGALVDSALARALAAADVLCLPSIERSEAFGLVLLEAMRAGVPCVATAVPGSGMAEVVGAGAAPDRAGLVVPHGDAAALADALGALRADPALRVALGDQGRARFDTRFRIDRVAAAINGLYVPFLRR